MRFDTRFRSRFESRFSGRMDDLGVYRSGNVPGWVAAGASADLDFVNNRYWENGLLRLSPSSITGWSFTRSGSRYSDSSDGSLTLFGPNVPRRTDKGLAVHAGATNLFLNSGSPATQNITVTAQAYTLSFYGTGSITLSGASTAGPLNGTGANDRVGLTFTPSAGTLTLTVSGSIDKVQFETGSVATPHIPTAGSTASAGIDDVRITDLDAIGLTAAVLAAGFTVVVEVAGENLSTAYRQVLSIDDGTFNNRLSVALSSGSGRTPRATVSSGGSTTCDINGFEPSSSPFKIATRFAPNDTAVVASGLTIVKDASVTLPSSVSALVIGGRNSPADSSIGDKIRRLTIYPYALTDAQLQAVST